MKADYRRGAWIYYQLRLRELTAAELARRLGVSREMVSQVINGVKKSRRIQEAIVAAIGMSFEVVWGDNHRGTKDQRKSTERKDTAS